MPADSNPPKIPTPCIGICRLGSDGLCVGCLRSGGEIARWAGMGDDERLRLMRELPRRTMTQPPFDHLLSERATLLRALHPLQDGPPVAPWNLHEIGDLMPSGELAQAAVLAGLVPRPDGTTVLLTRRTDSLRTHAGQVSFPGGRIDPDDHDAVAAALRETWEEIGVPPSQVRPLGLLDPFITASGFSVVPVVAAVHPEYVARPNPNEVAEVFEVPLAYLMQRQSLRHVELDWKGRPRMVWEYDWPGQRIWGATAAILYNLRQRLENVA